MSSNSQSALSNKSSSTPKVANPSSQVSPAHSQLNASIVSEGLGQRRSGGGSGSFATSTPRNNQSAKAKNKQSRKFRLADEDALAESVSDCVRLLYK